MDALTDLFNFVHSAVHGICDDQASVLVKASKSGKTVTLIVGCNPEDLRFVYAKLSHITQLARAIAQRNKSLVNIVIADAKDGCYVET